MSQPPSRPHSRAARAQASPVAARSLCFKRRAWPRLLRHGAFSGDGGGVFLTGPPMTGGSSGGGGGGGGGGGPPQESLKLLKRRGGCAHVTRAGVRGSQ